MTTEANGITRREFIECSACSAAAAMIAPSAFAEGPQGGPTQAGATQGGTTAAAHAGAAAPAGLEQGGPNHASANLKSQRLLSGWEYHAGSLGGVWEVWRGKEVASLPWQGVELPHCFNARDAVDPDQPYYQGPGWYRTHLKIANPYPNGRTLLHFEGAGQTTEVFVYLERLARHVGGYDEFVVDITEAIAKLPASVEQGVPVSTAEQGIPVAVRCDNSRDLERIPSDLSDFTLYGGLYRYVNLVYVPAVSIERVHVVTAVGQGQGSGKATASVKARLYNPGGSTGSLQLAVHVLDPKGRVIHEQSRQVEPWSGDQVLFDFSIPHPQLWSPSQPALYRCELTLTGPQGAMTVSERFGLRHFEFVTHGPFKLNGDRLLIRGTQRHEDHAGLGAAMPEALIRQEMQLIKDVGANFIRLGHYQQSRTVLDLCDELGLLVWEEVPWCRGGVGGPAYRQQARDMLHNLIDQHYNHPSIILWSLGNENDWPGDFPQFSREEVRAFMSELNEIAHRLDPGRKTSIRRCDFAKDIPDVYSPSIWMGWYRGIYTEYRDESSKEMQKVEHFLHMEWGGDSHAGRHSELVDRAHVDRLVRVATAAAGERSSAPGAAIAAAGTSPIGYDFPVTGSTPNASKQGVWSETYICDLFDWCLKEQESMPWLTGAAQWVFKDFATPSRPENPVPRVNQKGLVERDLTPKEGYYVFQSYWSDRPMVHIYGHRWPIRSGEAGERKLVKVYSNCDTVELFVNGASCGVRKRDSRDFPAAGLRWLVTFQPGENRIRAVGRKHGSQVMDEVRLQYQTEHWAKVARLELKEIARDRDVAVLEVSARDERQILCLDARNRIRFELAGEGELRDNLGTASGSRVVELANGRARISVLVRKAGAVVSVASEGLPAAFLSLT